jgi:hypothetical protein
MRINLRWILGATISVLPVLAFADTGGLTKRKRPYLVTAASAAIVAAAALTPAAGGYAATSTSGTTVSQLTVTGTTALASQSGTATDGLTNEAIPNFVAHQPKNPNLNHVSAARRQSRSTRPISGGSWPPCK